VRTVPTRIATPRFPGFSVKVRTSDPTRAVFNHHSGHRSRKSLARGREQSSPRVLSTAPITRVRTLGTDRPRPTCHHLVTPRLLSRSTSLGYGPQPIEEINEVAPSLPGRRKAFLTKSALPASRRLGSHPSEDPVMTAGKERKPWKTRGDRASPEPNSGVHLGNPGSETPSSSLKGARHRRVPAFRPQAVARPGPPSRGGTATGSPGAV
jgi:hypothetical protein